MNNYQMSFVVQFMQKAKAVLIVLLYFMIDKQNIVCDLCSLRSTKRCIELSSKEIERGIQNTHVIVLVAMQLYNKQDCLREKVYQQFRRQLLTKNSNDKGVSIVNGLTIVPYSHKMVGSSLGNYLMFYVANNLAMSYHRTFI